MSYEVLSRKYRPKSFNELVGQKHVSQTLSNAIKLNRIAHSYLFAGLRGTGKTTAARIMAKELNQSDVSKISSGSDLDVIELDGASNRGIDEIRDLKESVKYPPVSGKYKIYIIDEVHMLTNEAFNALLKTLEEPPSYVVFILATTDPFKLPTTILSRSQRFEFRSLSKTEIHQHLKFVLAEEGLKSDEESLNAISVHSGGSMRDALSLLDQVIAFSNGDIELSLVEEMLGSISQESLMEILLNIYNGKIKEVIDQFNSLKESGISFSNFISTFNTLVCNSINYLITNSNKKFFSDDLISLLDASSFNVIWLVGVLEEGSKCQLKMKNSENPSLVVELFLLSTVKSVIKSTATDDKHEIEISDSNAKNLNQVNDQSKGSTLKSNIIANTQKHEPVETVKESPTNPFSDQSWNSFLNSIENSSPRLAGFLDSSKVKFDQNCLTIVFETATQFQINSLEKGKEKIIETINNYYNTSIQKLVFEFEKLEKQERSQQKSTTLDHPLTNEILENFDGEIIR